jgi:hypothetical protein
MISADGLLQQHRRLRQCGVKQGFLYIMPIVFSATFREIALILKIFALIHGQHLYFENALRGEILKLTFPPSRGYNVPA